MAEVETRAPVGSGDDAPSVGRPGSPAHLEALAISQLEHALDAHTRGLKVYESLKSLNDVIGTQYGDRVLFELLQNAHDAHAADEHGEIAVRLILDGDSRGELLVANRGRPFTASNLEAIRNIGTSDKEVGEGIGNKGLGFRSVEALTDDVRIYSAGGTGTRSEYDGYCFRFATIDEIAAGVARLGADEEVAAQVAANVPRYLVPMPIKTQSEQIRALAKEGFATVVSLPLASADAVNLARRQVGALRDSTAPVLLFLDRLAALNLEVVSDGKVEFKQTLKRTVQRIDAPDLGEDLHLERAVLDGGNAYLLVRRTVAKSGVLDAVRESLSAAPSLKRWLNWKGDAVVSIAVRLDGLPIAGARLFNFLPMDEAAVSPLAGHIDAPFFADIDRRSIKPDLPLNKHLLEAAAVTAAIAALAIVDHGFPLAEAAVVDMACWSGPHAQKIINAFAQLQRPLTKAAIWPVVSGGGLKWAGFDTLYAWPDARTHQLTPARVAAAASAAIVPTALGEARLSRMRLLAAAVSMPLAPGAETLASWTESVAEHFAGSTRSSARRWREFYDDITALFTAESEPLTALEGAKILMGSEGKLLAATATGLDGAPPVFYRPKSGRGRRREGPPSPPPSLSRKFRFVQDAVDLGESTLRAFEKAGLLRRYDPLEALGGLKGALGQTPTQLQRREALVWSFRVWRAGGGKAVEDALRASALHVPTLGGWYAASEALFSGTWSPLGRTLEQYLLEAAPTSPDCSNQRDRLILSFGEWPRAGSDDRREDWGRFLALIGVRDGLQPVAGEIRRAATPSSFWNMLFLLGKAELGLGPSWTAEALRHSLSHPQTEYRLDGEVWRLPGQLEHDSLPESAKESLSELIVTYVRERGDEQFTFTVKHWRGWEQVKLPTPVQLFLRDGDWVAGNRRDEVTFAKPAQSWSTTVPRQIPPRFVSRFSAEPGSRGALPSILFDSRVGLRDWALRETAPDRLASLAAALSDLSAAERRDLRDQLRRAWSDIADLKLAVRPSTPLVVERAGTLEVCSPNSEDPPVVHITSERQGFAARALIDRGEAVLDVGETNGATISDVLNATGAFAPRLADTGDVRLIVDGEDFQPRESDPLLVSGPLSWLSDAAVLAHEYLGDPLELRTLSPDELDRRLRQIRVRRCNSFALLIGGEEISARADDQIQAVPHPRAPTLLLSGVQEIGVDVLIDAAPALTKLMGSRRNTLEPMLGRLMRGGFAGGGPGPTEEALARAIQRDVAVVRDHFAATRGGIERRVRALIPVVAHLGGMEAAARLEERHERFGPSLRLMEWLRQEFGADLADKCMAAVEDTEDQRAIRKSMGFDFVGYGSTLAGLGYPPLNDPADFERLFAVFVNEVRPSILDRVRRRYFRVWKAGGDLSDYVAHRRLDFISFDSRWPVEREMIDRDFVLAHVAAAAEAALGPDQQTPALSELERVTSANRKLISSRYGHIASVVRAWCRKQEVDRPAALNGADPQPLIRLLDAAGLIDFEAVKAPALPSLIQRGRAWPENMPVTDDLVKLELEEADLEHEQREAREEKRKAEIEKRTIVFAGSSLDTGDTEFAGLFERLAEAALAQGTDWFARSRPPRLALQEQRETGRKQRGQSGGKGQSWRNQPPEAIRAAMGVASEWLAREYLRRRHPREMSDDCWVSSNRSAFCSGDDGDDSLGYDFRVVTARREYLYEVKSALDAGGEFELSARELEVAGSASQEHKRRYRILYVPYVFDPAQWHVLPLMNPAAASTRDRFRLVRSGSSRYRFELR